MHIRINFLALRFRIALFLVGLLSFIPQRQRAQVARIILRALGITVKKRSS